MPIKTPERVARAQGIHTTRNKAGKLLTDAQASTVPGLYDPWAKERWPEITKDTIWQHGEGGQLWKFRLEKLNDESQNREPGSEGSEALWAKIAFVNGVKVIPFPRRALTNAELFAKGELGYWEGDEQAKRGVYKAPADATSWPPGTTGVNWTFVRDEP